ncbi:unnamed protein product [Parnassius apollo]|uniref:(apollo) hypothetical protein n=1 Tax=Parnassius apollo TaxID=110799 RepID=A0A8S3WLW3_PARAO|nr:unnamed protein product [Parnassius apollo]
MSNWRANNDLLADFMHILYAYDYDLSEDNDFEPDNDEVEDVRSSSSEAYSPPTPGRREQPGDDVEAVGFEEENHFRDTSPEGRDRSPRPYQS